MKSRKAKIEFFISLELLSTFDRKRRQEGFETRSALLRHLIRQWLSSSSSEQQGITTSTRALTEQFKPPFEDFIPLLQHSFSRGEFLLEHEWVEWLMNQGCSQERAVAIFENLKGSLLFRGNKGWALG